MVICVVVLCELEDLFVVLCVVLRDRGAFLWCLV